MRRYALLLFALALASGLGGVVSGAFAADPPPTVFTINVSSAGFDPATCRISRRDRVVWKNTGIQPSRVIWPSPNDPVPLFDTGTLAPGQTSSAFSGFEFPGNYRFQDAANSRHIGLVVLPTLTNSVEPDCSPTGAPGPSGPSTLPRRAFVPLLTTDR